MNSINDLIDNDLRINLNQQFAAIIGSNPSKGARSPSLWNAAFKGRKLPIRMIPLDVSPQNLPTLLSKLSELPTFIGGAVAVPHKNTVAEFLSNSITSESLHIGAVNSLFRTNNGQLYGTNTDGEASLIALRNQVGDISGKNILILGAGGAAKAVASYMSNGVGPKGKVFVASRDPSRFFYFKEKLKVEDVIDWSQISSFISKSNIIINCTSIGSELSIDQSPLSDQQLELCQEDMFIYDIIYQPRPTLFLKKSKQNGLKTLDGLNMNLEQAVLAFTYAMRNQIDHIEIDEIRAFMLSS